MSVISIFSGRHCSADAVIQDVIDSTGHRLITDDRIVQKRRRGFGHPGEQNPARLFGQDLGFQHIHPRKGVLHRLPA